MYPSEILPPSGYHSAIFQDGRRVILKTVSAIDAKISGMFICTQVASPLTFVQVCFQNVCLVAIKNKIVL